MNTYHLWSTYSALGTALSVLGALTHLIFTPTPCDRFCYNYFIAKETEVKRCEATLPGLHSW